MTSQGKAKFVIWAFGAFVMWAVYLTWDGSLKAIFLFALGAFFFIGPFLKMKTIDRICERIGLGFF